MEFVFSVYTELPIHEIIQTGNDAFQQSSLTFFSFLKVFMEFAVFLIVEMMNYFSNNKYTWFSWAILHNSFCHLY